MATRSETKKKLASSAGSATGAPAPGGSTPHGPALDSVVENEEIARLAYSFRYSLLDAR